MLPSPSKSAPRKSGAKKGHVKTKNPGNGVVSGIPLVSGLRTRMQDPHLCVVFGGPGEDLSLRLGLGRFGTGLLSRSLKLKV